MMRFTLTAKAGPSLGSNVIPLLVTLKPAGRCRDTYEYNSDSGALLRMLRSNTEVSGYELAAFDGNLKVLSDAQLQRVELKDKVLREIGFFID